MKTIDFARSNARPFPLPATNCGKPQTAVCVLNRSQLINITPVRHFLLARTLQSQREGAGFSYPFSPPPFRSYISLPSRCFSKMIGQKTINSFFSPVSKKRISKDVNESEKDAKHPKKPKSSAVESEVSSPAPSPLSPDQLERIARNKRAAMEKRTSAQTPPGFGESWREGLSEEFEKPYFKKLMDFVSKERTSCTVYPPAEEVFTWTQMCDIRDVKVVILGQDPYHGPGQAHGLCFSVKKPVRPPPSLENMYKELVTDIEGFQHPRHGDLTGWSEQGVLLLNAVLTVRASNANSHKDRGWETFTDAVVQWLSNNQEGLVFMLWGAYAQKKGAAIDRKRHHVLQAVHPSPLSAHRGFFGCSHFSKANELLVQSGKSPINWKSL